MHIGVRIGVTWLLFVKKQTGWDLSRASNIFFCVLYHVMYLSALHRCWILRPSTLKRSPHGGGGVIWI